jgi:hypothetical protein
MEGCRRSRWSAWIVVACVTLAAALAGFAHARSGAHPQPRPQLADLLANPPTCLDAGDETAPDAAHPRPVCLGCLLAQALPPAAAPTPALRSAWTAAAAIPGRHVTTAGHRRSPCSTRGPPTLPA